jgi:hypothetical protein
MFFLIQVSDKENDRCKDEDTAGTVPSKFQTKSPPKPNRRNSKKEGCQKREEEFLNSFLAK